MSFTGPFDFQKGDLLEGMTIVSPLVRGGHGDLYLVNEDVEQKKVLKVIQRADNDGELTGIEKCRAVSSHIPGLVPILKVGKLPSGRIWCVMPPADNLAQWPNYEPDTLANRIARNGRLQPEEVLRLIGEIECAWYAAYDDFSKILHPAGGTWAGRTGPGSSRPIRRISPSATSAT